MTVLFGVIFFVIRIKLIFLCSLISVLCICNFVFFWLCTFWFDLFSYTDGLIEIQNGYGDFYGTLKIKKLFEGNRNDPENFIELVKTDLDEFKGNNISYDDTTLLMISVRNV